MKIIRTYKPKDCEEIIKLFYDTVHNINIKDYNKEQVDVWAPKEIDIHNIPTTLQSIYNIFVLFDLIDI